MEIAETARCCPADEWIGSVYWGGGTPSLMSGGAMADLMGLLHSVFHILPEAEITLEANPGTVSFEKLKAFRRAGVNRISYGVQTMQPDELQVLGRIHSCEEAAVSFELARLAGFENISLDLIYGLPLQTPDRWLDTLRQVLAFAPEHLSLYGLTVEEGTFLQQQVLAGQVLLPDADLAAEMYETARVFLEERGYRHYEISNWAVRSEAADFRSRHNLQYWHADSYLGFGAGAHGYYAGTRYFNVYDTADYIALMKKRSGFDFPFSPAVAGREEIHLKAQMQEFMMLGLRLTEEGADAARFSARFKTDMRLVFARPLAKLEKQGLITWKPGPDRVCLTPRGQLLGNRVFREFV